MDLILWRHAEAEDNHNDMARKLTEKGQQQAKVCANWLRHQLAGKNYSIYTSEAIRTQQTATYLQKPIYINKLLNPDTSVHSLIRLLQQQSKNHTAIWVGHQPWLGQLCSYLLNGVWLPQQFWIVKKSAFWWFHINFYHQHPHGHLKVVLNPNAVIASTKIQNQQENKK